MMEHHIWDKAFLNAPRKQYPRKASILSEATEGDCVMMLEHGLAAVSRRDENGREHLLALRQRGALLGETAVVAKSTRSADVVAFYECRVRVLDRNAFLRRVENLGLDRQLLQVETAKRLELEDELVIFRTQSTTSRLARTLVTIVDATGSNEIEGWNQDAIAQLVGVQRPSFTDALNKLRRAGILKTQIRLMIVSDYAALRVAAGM